MAAAKKATETHYLNVDLDIYSRSDLQPLVDALGRKVTVLYVGREGRTYSAHLELAAIKLADGTIVGLCKLIAALPADARKLWDGAKTREFNIGVEAGREPLSWEMNLAPATVKTVADLGGSIAFTVYSAE